MPPHAEDNTRADALLIAGLFIEVHRGLTHELTASHARNGLLGSDFDALLRLRNSPDQTLRTSDLASQVGLTPSGVTKLVDRLTSNGWADRTPCPHDRRTILVQLTTRGAQLCDQAADAVVPIIQDQLLAPLGTEAAHFIDQLTRIRKQVAPDAFAHPKSAVTDSEPPTPAGRRR